MGRKERKKKYKAIRDLSSNAKKIVCRIHKISEEAWNAIEFIMNSGKVPELIMRKAFKDKTKKYDVTGWTPFLYINLKKAPFFLYGESIAISKVALFDLTKLVEKEIKVAKESEKEDLEQALFYFEELHSKLPSKMKGCATGKIKFIKYGKDKQTAHLLVKKADFEKEGPGSKENFLDNINDLELENSSKTKMVLSFVQEGETATDVSKTTDDPEDVRKKAEIIQKIKELQKGINKLNNDILPRFKNKAATERDAAFVKALRKAANLWLSKLLLADPKLVAKFASQRQQLQKEIPQWEELENKILGQKEKQAAQELLRKELKATVKRMNETRAAIKVLLKKVNFKALK